MSNEIISNQICSEFLKMLKSSRFYQILQCLTRFYHIALDFLSNLHKQTLGVTRKAFWQLIRSKIDKSTNVTRDYSTHASLVFTLDFNRAKQKSIDWNLHTYRPQKSLHIVFYIATALHTYPDSTEKSLQISPRNADDNFLLKIGSEPQTSIHEHFN